MRKIEYLIQNIDPHPLDTPIIKTNLCSVFDGKSLCYRFCHKDFGKAPDQNYPQAYNSTLRTNFYLGT